MLNDQADKRLDRPMIAGCGLVVLDIILNNGDVRPIFSAGGTCGNVLAGLSHLGWSSLCIARSGDDLAGELLAHDLLKNGVDISRISRESGLLTPRIVERLLSDGHSSKHNFLLRCPTCKNYLPRFQSPRLDQIEGISTTCIRPDSFFYDRVTPSTMKLAQRFRSDGSLIFFEPGKVKSLDNKTREAIRISHIVKTAGPETPPELYSDWSDGGREEAERCAEGLVIRTLGKYGLVFRSGTDGEWQYQPGYKPFELHDCCGAGDWCSIGFLYRLKQLAKEKNITIIESISYRELVRSALEFAQALSALSCSFVGARGLSDAMTMDELLDAVHSRLGASELPDLFFTEGIIKKIRRKRRSATYRISQRLVDELCPTCLLPRNSR